MGKEDLEEALPDEDDEGDDYDRDEDFDGDYHGSEAFVLKGSDELAMDYDVFGKYLKSAQVENGKAVFLGPKIEGSRPSIAFQIAADGKPTWWICDASAGECFYAESDSDIPPRKGWRKEYSDDELEVVFEAEGTSGEKDSRPRSRSPRREKCPW